MASLAERTLLALYQHRLMTTTQAWQLLSAHAATARWQREVLAGLHADGLVDSTTARSSTVGRTRVWWCTPRGAAHAEASHLIQPRPYRMSAEKAAGAHQHHTLAVTDVGLAFHQWAGRLGDECGPLDWIPEVAHALTTNEQRSDLVADALLTYVVDRDRRRTSLQLAIELDRATMSIDRLASKILTYCRYYTWTPAGAAYPAWRRRYAHFPRLIVVLTGRDESILTARMDDVRARLSDFPQVMAVRTAMHAHITTLQQLQDAGPHADIMAPLFFPGAEARALFPAPREAVA